MRIKFSKFKSGRSREPPSETSLTEEEISFGFGKAPPERKKIEETVSDSGKDLKKANAYKNNRQSKSQNNVNCHENNKNKEPNAQFQEYSRNQIKISNNKLSRANSMAKLGSWVQQQKVKRQSQTNTSSRQSYLVGNGRNEISSGTASQSVKSQNVENNSGSKLNQVLLRKGTTLPRPVSFQDVSRSKNHTAQIMSWKSVNQMNPDGEQSETEYERNAMRVKAEEILSWSSQQMKTSPRPFTVHTFKRSREPSSGSSPVVTSSSVGKPPLSAEGKHKSESSFMVKQNKVISKEKIPEINSAISTSQLLLKNLEKLETEKWRLELSSKKTNAAIDKNSIEALQTKISNVCAHINETKEKLEEASSNVNEIEKNLNTIKATYLEKLNDKHLLKTGQNELVLKLGRIQFALEKLKITSEEINRSRKKYSAVEKKYAVPATPVTPKRIGTQVEDIQVPHVTSAKHSTVDSISRFTSLTAPRPYIPRTQSAAERLSRSHGNLFERSSTKDKSKKVIQFQFNTLGHLSPNGKTYSKVSFNPRSPNPRLPDLDSDVTDVGNDKDATENHPRQRESKNKSFNFSRSQQVNYNYPEMCPLRGCFMCWRK